MLITILALTAAPIVIHKTHAAAITEIYEDFENWNANNWLNQTGGTGGTKLLDIPNSTAALNGSYGAWFKLICATGAISAGIYNNSLTPRDTYWLDFYWKPRVLDIGGGAGQDYVKLGYITDTGTEQYYELVIWETDRKFAVLFRDGSYSYVFANSTIPVVTGVKYHVQLGVKQSDSGFVQLYIDGELGINWSGDNNPQDYLLDYVWAGNWAYLGNMSSYYDDIRITSELIPDTGGNFAIDNLEGCGDWVFVNERYYYFNVTVEDVNTWQNITLVEMNFTTPTENGLIENLFAYNASSGEFSVGFSSDNLTVIAIDEQPVKLSAGPVANCSLIGLSVYFYIMFNPVCIDVWENAVDVGTRATYSSGSDSGWNLFVNQFYIYSHGGFSYNTTLFGYENAGRITPGGPFEIWAENGSGIEVDYWFNDLQAIQMRPEIFCITGYPSFYVRYYFDFCLNGYDWIPGLYLHIQAQAVTYGSERYINFSMYWGYGSGVGSYFGDHGYIYFFHTGDAAAKGATTQTQFWVDMWLGRMNGSASIGGRINAYQYPMRNNADEWLRWLNTNWGPYDGLSKESTVEMPLAITYGGETISTQEIKMVRVKARLYVSAHATDAQYVELRNYMAFHLTQGARPIEPIDTPSFQETTTPVMPMGGLLGVIYSGLMYIGQFIGENIIYGGLNVWGSFVAFMDTIAAWLGFPNAFTNMITYLTTGFNWLIDSFNYLISLIAPFFTFIGSFMGKAITVIVETATQWAAIAAGAWNFLNGGLTAGFNVFTNLGIWNFIVVGIIAYPIYLIFLWDEEGIGAAIDNVKFLMDIASFFLGLFLGFVQLILNLIGRIIESIPVIE